MIKRDGFIIWTLYFDASLTRSGGRRVPTKTAVRNPSQDLLVRAAEGLGWRAEPLVARHPSRWWRTNVCVLVTPPKGVGKWKAVRMIAERLRELR